MLWFGRQDYTKIVKKWSLSFLQREINLPVSLVVNHKFMYEECKFGVTSSRLRLAAWGDFTSRMYGDLFDFVFEPEGRSFVALSNSLFGII